MATLARATKADLDALLALEQKSFDAGSFPLTRRAFAYHITRGTPLWCLFEGEKLAGYILLFLYKKSGRIYSLAVDPAYAGQGFGKILMHKALDDLKAIGRQKAFLEVREDNRKAIRLYELMGFGVTRRLPAYYDDGCDGVKMVIDLAGHPKNPSR